MKLYYSATSPFARKVRLMAHALGIDHKIELISLDVFNPSPHYKEINPLIKVPALETDSGEFLVNSPFICQYLSQITPGGQKLFPMGPQWLTTMNMQAVADGGADAGVARRLETHLRGPDKFDQKFDRRQKDKMENALGYFEARTHLLSKTDLTIKEISVICFIGYIELRFAHEKWGERFPKIYAWADH